MKWATLFLLCLPAWADSISLPTGGFAWNTGQVTVGNIEGDYSPTMPLIYALQFSGGYLGTFYLKVADIAYNGTFSDWSFSDGLFRGTFTGVETSFSHGTFSLLGQIAISGVLAQQLNLIPGCFGYSCGSMGTGQMTLSQGPIETVPEPSSAMLMLTSLASFGAMYLKRR